MMNITHDTPFADALAAFVEHAQSLQGDYDPDQISVSKGGRKYLRIVRTRPHGGGQEVFCFIEKTTGNVLKAAGWKAPAPGARGTIYNEGHVSRYGVNEYGAVYWG
jgi:hypothetical protein